MFLDEARLSAHLSHSNVVSVFDIGVGDGTYFIVMEYVDGADLKAVMDHSRKIARPIPVESAIYIARRICQGLAYAHELKNDGKSLEIIHRDITPANVLITKYGEVKIVDFGLAKASSQLAESDAGVIKGKFGYLAPETVMEKPVDQRVDVFALGIILWEMLAGRRLFQGETDFQTVRQVRDAVIPSLPPINRAVPAELDELVKHALARDPDARYQTAREFGRDLTRFLFRYGRPVGDEDVGDLVKSALGVGGAQTVDGVKKIADMIDLMLLEFRSLTKEEQDKTASPSLFPDMSFKSSAPPPAGGDDTDSPLGGLADELEGPEPTLQEESSVASWFRGFIR
jgi:serine/threonine-protein kinase